jgi:hypothetical protein
MSAPEERPTVSDAPSALSSSQALEATPDKPPAPAGGNIKPHQPTLNSSEAPSERLGASGEELGPSRRSGADSESAGPTAPVVKVKAM